MADSLVILAAREFLDLAWTGPTPEPEALCAALDRVLAAGEAIPSAEWVPEAPSPPDHDYWGLLSQGWGRFPDFGYYMFDDPELGQTMGYALEDLCDVTLDLGTGLWLAEHAGPEAGHYHLGQLHFHWAWHARYLAAYLRQRGRPGRSPWEIARL